RWVGIDVVAGVRGFDTRLRRYSTRERGTAAALVNARARDGCGTSERVGEECRAVAQRAGEERCGAAQPGPLWWGCRLDNLLRRWAGLQWRVAVRRPRCFT